MHRWLLLLVFCCVNAASLRAQEPAPAQTPAASAPDLPEAGNDVAKGVVPSPGLQGKPGFDGRPATTSAPIRLTLEHPQEGALLQDARFEPTFKIDNFTLVPNGNRIQFVLDNRKSVLVWDTQTPVVFEGLAPGGHTLRVFAASGRGDLVKETLIHRHFYVGKESADNMPVAGEPVLTVSSPRGSTYTDREADLIVFDYRVDGVALSPSGFRLRYLLNGRPYFRWEQGPVFFAKLPPGIHRLIADVVDIEGNPMPGHFARVEVPFEVVDSTAPAPDQEPPHPARPQQSAPWSGRGR